MFEWLSKHRKEGDAEVVVFGDVASASNAYSLEAAPEDDAYKSPPPGDDDVCPTPPFDNWRERYLWAHLADRDCFVPDFRTGVTSLQRDVLATAKATGGTVFECCTAALARRWWVPIEDVLRQARRLTEGNEPWLRPYVSPYTERAVVLSTPEAIPVGLVNGTASSIAYSSDGVARAAISLLEEREDDVRLVPHVRGVETSDAGDEWSLETKSGENGTYSARAFFDREADVEFFDGSFKRPGESSYSTRKRRIPKSDVVRVFRNGKVVSFSDPVEYLFAWIESEQRSFLAEKRAKLRLLEENDEAKDQLKTFFREFLIKPLDFLLLPKKDKIAYLRRVYGDSATNKIAGVKLLDVDRSAFDGLTFGKYDEAGNFLGDDTTPKPSEKEILIRTTPREHMLSNLSDARKKARFD